MLALRDGIGIALASKVARLVGVVILLYKKAGVTVSNIVPSDQIQGSLFGYDEDLRQKHDRLSELMDSVNSTSVSGRSLLRLASQRPGHYADGIRCDFRSGLYTTSFDEIIKVR